MKLIKRFSIFVVFTLHCIFGLGLCYAETLAFPGAEGFGAYVSGGRFGPVLKVTNLNPSGPGSLQYALNQEGPRIIVFSVSGVIKADEIIIPHGDLTLAGQTASGAGITIEGRLIADYGGNANNIIVRHIRVRPPVFSNQVDGEQYDAIQFGRSQGVILDHVTASFGVDETVDLYSSRDVTVQWSSIEMSATSGHPESGHNYGLINGPKGGNLTLHHNIFAHHKKRTPALSVGPSETINNIMYNVKDAWVHHNPARGQFIIENNFFKQGPSASLLPFFLDAESIDDSLTYYFSGNHLDTANNYSGLIDPWPPHPENSELKYTCSYFTGGDCIDYKTDIRPDFSNIKTYKQVSVQSLADAYSLTLEKAGAFPRDEITKRVVTEIGSRSGEWGARIPSNLLDGLIVEKEPLDSDGDGMSDSWEKQQNLNPIDASDHSTIMGSGYTAIEEYINGLADALVGVSSCCALPNPPGNFSGAIY